MERRGIQYPVGGVQWLVAGGGGSGIGGVLIFLSFLPPSLMLWRGKLWVSCFVSAPIRAISGPFVNLADTTCGWWSVAFGL